MKNEKKLKYHITLTNNETGEVFLDHDTSAIIGAAQGPDDSARGICAINCSGFELFQTLSMAIGALEEVRTLNPSLYEAAEIFSQK